jgi:peptidoglycan DL-endopeptidase CwlO
VITYVSTRSAAQHARVPDESPRDHRAEPRRALRRGIALGISAAAAAGALAAVASVAGAAPQPSVGQVQKAVNKLTSQEDQAAQQYDQTEQQLSAARQRLTLVNQQVKTAQDRFRSMQQEIAAIASTAYENGTMTSMGAMFTSDNPQAVLNQASVLLQLSSDRSTQISQFIAAARELSSAQRSARRTEQAIATLDAQRLARKKSLGKSLGQQKAILATLTAQQQAQVTQTSTIGAGGSTTSTYSGPTSTQAEKAVAYAYSKLGDPYVYGATGPSTFDCSGLAQAAWAYAGVGIPRTTYEQVAALPAVSTSNLQPGDLLFFDGDGHVGIYVGGGYLIDAPQTGSNVEKVALSGWYSANLDSAARP